MEDLTFEEYCKKKKIDPDLFLAAEPERFQEWKGLFEQMHPASFSEQKRFLMNPIRMQYLLIEKNEDEIKVSNDEGEKLAAPKASIKIPPLKKS